MKMRVTWSRGRKCLPRRGSRRWLTGGDGEGQVVADILYPIGVLVEKAPHQICHDLRHVPLPAFPSHVIPISHNLVG